MRFFMEFGALIWAFAIILFIWQVMIPGLNDTPFFPLFRSRHRKAVKGFTEAVEDRELTELEAEAEASAMRGSQWVPLVVNAGGGSGTQAGGGGNGAADLITLFTAKAAKDLALDMSIPSRTAPRGPTFGMATPK